MPPFLYAELSEYYDLIYHWKDYSAEADRLRSILITHSIPDGSTIADVACGTGSHLVHLARWYKLIGADQSPEMITLARRKLPDAQLMVRGMADGLNVAPVSVILCLFSAFGYLISDEEIELTIAAFASGVVAGGLLILEPWLDPAHFRPGTAAMHTYDSPDLKLCRSVVTRRENNDIAVLEFHWLIAAAGSPRVAHEVEVHRLRLLQIDSLLAKLKVAGFRPSFQPTGLTDDRGLIVAVRE